MFLVKNMRKLKIQQLYNALLPRRSLSINQPLLQHNKAFQKFKLKQARMQCAYGPVYLKGGIRDRILFAITLALVLCSTFQSICIIKEFVEKF